MSRVRLIALTAIAVVATALSVAGARAAAGGFSIASAHATFPERAVVLTLPSGMALDRQSVRVLENGAPVEGLSLVPAGRAAARSFGFALALDSSNSMRGAPAEGALAAARAFAGERPVGATLGLVTFNSQVNVILEPSLEATAIDSALSRRPRLLEGTRMRDAVAQAISLLAQSRVRAGSVVVLSDGADVGSRTGTAELVRLARAAGVRVFTVGLRSPQFAPAALRALAAATGGRYVEATDAAALAPLYRELGRQLASEYLIRYRSVASGTHTYVSVQVRGLTGVATLEYDLPAPRVFHEPWQERFWRSWIGLLATALLAAALAAVAAVLVLRVLRPSLGSRLAAYIGPDLHPPREDPFGDRVTEVLDRSLARVRGWRGFAEEVEIARVPVSASSLAACAIMASLALALIAALVGEALLLVLAILPPLGVRSYVKRKLRRLRRQFEHELPDNVQVLASALRAGHGLSGALGVVTRDTVEPAHSEFERALSDERLGMPLEDALSNVAARMASSDLEQVALVAALHRQTGGNTAEVLDRVHDALRERAELRRMVRALTAEGRLTRWILTALPIGLVLILSVLDRSYLAPLFQTTGGRAALLVAALMVVAGSWVIKRIVEIEI